jgi:hypothetical protein
MADLKWAEALYKINTAATLTTAADLLRLYPVALLKTAAQKAWYQQLQMQVNATGQNTNPAL